MLRMLRTLRIFWAGLIMLGLGSALAMAQGPFGVGAPEAAPIPANGIFSDFFRWIAAEQSAFYKQLTGTVREMKQNGSAVWTLVGLSFLYGVFHAAGPGHGKVVMSSYVLANRETARRGAVLCLLSSLLQATVAIGVISILAIVFNATSLVISDATWALEIGSYALVAVLGIYLIGKSVRRIAAALSGRPVAASLHDGKTVADHHHHDDHCGCNHAHAPAAALADQAGRGIRAAATAVLSVGLRPCTGALIVLVFALAQGLFWAGILSAFAMGLGTAITVTALMFFAVGTRRATLVLAGGNPRSTGIVLNGVQLLGAVAVFTLGAVLLTASLRLF